MHPDATLEQRIVTAEHAVIERDQRLRGEAGQFMDRLRVQTRRGGRIAAVAAIVPFLLGWFMARSAPRSKSQKVEQYHQPKLSEAPWATLVPLLWPLLPSHLRARVSPGVASFLTGIGLPLLAQRMNKRRARKKADAAERAQQTAAANGTGPTHH